MAATLTPTGFSKSSRRYFPRGSETSHEAVSAGSRSIMCTAEDAGLLKESAIASMLRKVTLHLHYVYISLNIGPKSNRQGLPDSVDSGQRKWERVLHRLWDDRKKL